jgi:hypothetical protein
VQAGRGDRVRGGEQRDVMAGGHQPLGQQRGELLPRPVVARWCSATRWAPAPRFGSGHRPRRGWECGSAQATRARPDWLWRRQPDQPTGPRSELRFAQSRSGLAPL